MRSPKDFFAPLALGAPAPVREIPVTPSRMIHFFDPGNEKMAAKVPDIAKKVDVLLGNLEDAVRADRKEAARAGLVAIAKANDFGKTQLWTRVNSLDSPWVLDDLVTLVTEIGDKLDVIMVPKVEGAQDIHYVDRLLAQLEARAGLTKPLLVHAILETASGVANVEEIAGASPRMQGISLGPADLAANRRMKTTRVGGGHPGYLVRQDPVDGDVFLGAIDPLAEPWGPDDTRSLARRRADALKDVVEGAQRPGGVAAGVGDEQPGSDDDALIPAPRRPEPENGRPERPGRALLTITMDLRWLQLATGHGVLGSEALVDPRTVRRWACDAEVVPVVLGSRSEPLDVGRLQRTVTDAIRRALNGYAGPPWSLDEMALVRSVLGEGYTTVRSW